jgi:uracil-DNA glycosylase
MSRHYLLPESCEGCELSSNSGCGKFTQVEGKGGLGVLVVAEASGEAEAAAGWPLRASAPSGGVFEKALRRAGYRREQFYVTNILRCRPPGNWLEGAPWEQEAIERCRENLDRAVEQLKPRSILALGGVPTRELTGLAGKKLSVMYLRGFVLASRYGLPVVPTIHPSYIARGNSQLLGRLMSDISTAVGVAQGWLPGPVGDPRELMTAHTSYEALLELFERARDNRDLLIAYDIETFMGSEEVDEDAHLEFSRDGAEDGFGEGEDGEDSGDDDNGVSDDPSGGSRRDSLDTGRAQIRTVQFALSEREGVSVPWDSGHRDLIAAVLALPNPKVGHNATWFDDPILERHGCSIGGRRDDTLVMYGCLQPDLPKHLQAVGRAYGWEWPWKHIGGSDIAFYGVADVCVLHKVMARLPTELRTLGLWDTYERRTQQYRRLVIRPMEIVGLPVSNDRVGVLREDLARDVKRMDEEIQRLAPMELRKLEAYKNMPPMIKEFVLGRHEEEFAPSIKTYKNGKTKEVKSKTKISDLYRWLMSQEPRYVETRDKVFEKWPQLVAVPDGEGRHLLAWEEPFNPASPLQMQAYLKLKGYRLPISFKTGRVTTSDKELTRLQEQTKDPLIKLVRERRIADKMIGSYTGRLQADGTIKGGWIPGSDGRLRATITFKSTGQLAASNPNTMTLPVRREELAESFRRCIAAEPGHQILELDMHAFHASTTGLAAGDAEYMRLSRLDIHSYVAGWLVKDKRVRDCLNWSDGDLLALLEEIKERHKPVRNKQAKPAILGIGFGMGWKRLYYENREYFANETEAKRLHDLLKSLFPLVFKWQEEVVDLADKQGYLANAFGRRRWFWDARTWKVSGKTGGWEKQAGRDAEKVKAFLPASNAHDMLREKCLELAEKGMLRKYELVNIVHDALVFHCPTGLVDEAASEVKKILEAPVLALAHPVICPGGFSCEAEASVGPDWAKGSMERMEI